MQDCGFRCSKRVIVTLLNRMTNRRHMRFGRVSLAFREEPGSKGQHAQQAANLLHVSDQEEPQRDSCVAPPAILGNPHRCLLAAPNAFAEVRYCARFLQFRPPGILSALSCRNACRVAAKRKPFNSFATPAARLPARIGGRQRRARTECLRKLRAQSVTCDSYHIPS